MGTTGSDMKREIAGGPDDFMTVHHLVLRGRQADIGARLAAEAVEAFGWQPRPAPDPVRNRARRRWFEQNWPAHYQRMAGAAKAYGADLGDDSLDLGTVLAAPVTPQCSVVWCSSKLSAEGRARVDRNMDFTTRTLSEILGGAPMANEPAVMSRPYVVESHPDDGYATIITAIGDLSGCVDGINDQGLVVALLADDESDNLRPSGAPQAGLYELHLARYLLDTCAEVCEAKEALYRAKQYDEYSVAHFFVADSEEAFVWERDTHNAEFAVEAVDGRMCVTNYLLHRAGVASPPEELQSQAGIGDAFRRAAVLHAGLGDAPIGREHQWELLESVRADGSRDLVDPAGRNRTLWHSQYDLDECSVGYEFYLGDEADGRSRRSPRFELSLGQSTPPRVPQ